MKIGIVSDSIRENSTGIGFYTKDLISEILKVDKKNNYVFIDYSKTDFNRKSLKLVKNPFRYFPTYLWHNYLPAKTRKLELDYIFNFTAVPHLFPFKQKEVFFVYDVSWYLFPKYHPKSRVLFYKYLFKRCLNNSYKIVVDSNSCRDDLIKFFSIPKEKIHVIYPQFTSEISTIKSIKYNIDAPYFLFIGTLEPRKNIESIIKAFANLKKNKNITQKLIICGKKGWLYETIFKLIDRLQINDEIIYLGYITNEEKKYLFEHAECFIYPSFYEGFGIPVLEALKYGCPVITSNISSLPEVAGKAGICINPKNVNEIEHVMEKVIGSKKLRENMKTEGFKQIKNLSNPKQIVSLLTSLAI